MSRIPDDNLEAIVYLYPTIEAAKQGLKIGGSGFIVGMRSIRFPDLMFTYIVTNRHVVKEKHCLVVRMNNPNGSTIEYESNIDVWQEHPDGHDLIVASLGYISPDVAQYKAIDTTYFVTPELIADYDIGIGDEVAMIGRFIGHDGKQKNMPSARFGNISMMPMNHSVGSLQESFAVEMRSVSGFSGSPVFVKINTYEPRPDSRKLQHIDLGNWGFQYYFLGVDWGHIHGFDPVYIKRGDELFSPPDNLVVKANTYLSGVVPAWKLMEILQMDKYRLSREAEEDKIAEQREAK